MKRTNLVLDAALLEEATRLSGEKTYSAAVQRALRDFVRLARSRRILDLRGSGAWQGDLAEMRRDPPQRKTRGVDGALIGRLPHRCVRDSSRSPGAPPQPRLRRNRA